jgi:hypothetical protein
MGKPIYPCRYFFQRRKHGFNAIFGNNRRNYACWNISDNQWRHGVNIIYIWWCTLRFKHINAYVWHIAGGIRWNWRNN